MQIIDIPSAKLLHANWHYNCGLLEWKGEMLFAYRRFFGPKSTVVVCKLDAAFMPIIGSHVELAFPPVIRGIENYQEDPRLLVHNDELYCAYINVTQDLVSQNQGLCKLNDKFEVTNNWFIDYGHNINAAVKGFAKTQQLQPGVFYTPANTCRVEKNWTFFSKGKDLYFVYEFAPYTVVRVDFKKSKGIPVKTKRTNIVWDYGQIRGGTPAIFVDGKYHTFFHSSYSYGKTGKRVFYNHARVYNIGYLTFDDKFNVLEVTKQPVIEGDIEAIRYTWHACVFPCGIMYKDGKWIVSYGVDDKYCRIAIIEKDELTTYKPMLD